MSSDPSFPGGDIPIYGDGEEYFTLEVFAELAGVHSETVLHYQKRGLIFPASGENADSVLFDTESLRQLRRIEHLRSTCEMNEAGLLLVLSLLREVEQLKHERRQVSG